MIYVNYINSLIQEAVKDESKLILFGQNIDAGSSLSGLTKGLSIQNDSLIINTQNSENSLVGVGFGLMLNNVSSVFFMKQMDFLILGIDHLVNTYNIIRQEKPNASFTIFPIIVDSGFEGPQSALNNFDDFCSIAGVEGYSFTNIEDSKEIISEYLVKPGFRILSTGQRLLKEESIDLKVIYKARNNQYFQYKKGIDATVVCFNQALPYGAILEEHMHNKSLSASLFSINSHLHDDYSRILDDISATKRLVIIDDSKSRNRLSDRFLSEVLTNCKLEQYKVISRKPRVDDFYPNNDALDINYSFIIEEMFNGNSKALIENSMSINKGNDKYPDKNIVNATIRKNIIQMISNGNAAHSGSALSLVEILNSIFLSVNVDKIKKMTKDRDRVVLSKGHGAACLYAVMHHHGIFSKNEIESYFKNGSLFAGHASHFIKQVEHSTGALGHGISAGLGMAIGSVSKGYKNRTFVIVGDGELNEGSNWEAIMFAGHKKINNLCILIDKNEYSQMSKVSEACSIDPLYDKFIAFNFNVIELNDGHDEEKIIHAIHSSKNSLKPVAIICNTLKGKGISFMEKQNIWHYRTPSGDNLQRALDELKRGIK